MAAPPRTRKGFGAWLLLIVIAICTLIALSNVVRLRFSSGDAYPVYSTRRADPVGTRALYEALGRMPDTKVETNFRRLDELRGAKGSTLILCGLDTRSFRSRIMVDAEAVGRFAADGGRVVVALNPQVSFSMPERAMRQALEEENAEDEERKKQEKQSAKEESKKVVSDPEESKKENSKNGKEPARDKDKEKNRRAHEREAEYRSFSETLKIGPVAIEFFYSGSDSGSPLTATAALKLKDDELPRWMSNAYLDISPDQDWTGDKATPDATSNNANTDQAAAKEPQPAKSEEPSPWTAIATKGDRIMIAERKLGAGSVVVCTDRHFLSNEALWRDPKTHFITWLIGDADRIIFDETHLGAFIGESDGVMTLVRRYGMHGLFLGLLLLFGLFVWRSALSLVPPNPMEDLGLWRADAVAGRSSASGLEGLLRRGFPTKNLLQRCFEIWQSTRSARLSIPADRVAKAEAILNNSANKKDVAATYKALRDVLHSRR